MVHIDNFFISFQRRVQQRVPVVPATIQNLRSIGWGVRNLDKGFGYGAVGGAVRPIALSIDSSYIIYSLLHTYVGINT